MESAIEDVCSEVRKECLELGEKIKTLIDHSTFKNEQSYFGQHEEMKANIMLSYRHFEDARMRVGKIMQAFNGGKSVYPK